MDQKPNFQAKILEKTKNILAAFGQDQVTQKIFYGGLTIRPEERKRFIEHYFPEDPQLGEAYFDAFSEFIRKKKEEGSGSLASIVHLLLPQQRGEEFVFNEKNTLPLLQEFARNLEEQLEAEKEPLKPIPKEELQALPPEREPVKPLTEGFPEKAFPRKTSPKRELPKGESLFPKMKPEKIILPPPMETAGQQAGKGSTPATTGVSVLPGQPPSRQGGAGRTGFPGGVMPAKKELEKKKTLAAPSRRKRRGLSPGARIALGVGIGGGLTSGLMGSIFFFS